MKKTFFMLVTIVVAVASTVLLDPKKSTITKEAGPLLKETSFSYRHLYIC